MPRAAFTLRIDLEERKALKSLSKIEGRPINQLLIEAIRIYLNQKGRREQSLEADLNSLKAYRKKDPGYRRAIASFVEAEAAESDPMEGEPFEEGNDSPSAAGPVQSKVREAIGG